MKTKNIDFTGCEPRIAEQLKQGKMIECWVWENDKKKGILSFVRHYHNTDTCRYWTGIRWYDNAEPCQSWFPEKLEPVLQWTPSWEYAEIRSFNYKNADAFYIDMFDSKMQNIRRVYYKTASDTLDALKLVSILIKSWPECDSGDINP